MNLLVDSACAITTATENTEKTCNVFRGKTGSLHVAGGPSQLKNKPCANLLQIRWDENEKRAYILDARSAGGSVMEVPNPIDFQGSYEDFYLMLLKAFSYFDATDLVRKLHKKTLLISKSHIQNPSKVSEDKATTTCWLSIMCPHNSILHAGKQQSTDLCAGAVLMGNTNNS